MQVIIDSNTLCYRSLYSIGKGQLTFENRETGIIFGVLNQILKIMFEKQSSNLIFCWDSKKSHRRLIYPDYKKGRKENKTKKELNELKNAYIQFDILKKKVIPALNFPSLIKTGFEADDLISYLVKKSKDSSIIVSTDHDLFQLLYRTKWNKFCTMYNLKKNITKETFEKEYNISPDKWAMVKAIAGCNSDNVKGVAGVGEKTAIDYLNGTINKKSKKYESIINSKDIIDRNLKLVSLPFPLKELNIEYEKKKTSINKFIDIFEKFNFKSLLKQNNLNKIKDFLKKDFLMI